MHLISESGVARYNKVLMFLVLIYSHKGKGTMASLNFSFVYSVVIAADTQPLCSFVLARAGRVPPFRTLLSS